MKHKLSAVQLQQERARTVMSHLGIAFPDRVFASMQEEGDAIVRCVGDAIVRCVDNASQVYAAVGVGGMWVCLGNIEVVCKKFDDVTDVFRKLLAFEQAIELQPGATVGEVAEATFAKYATQIKAVPGFADVDVRASDDEYQRPFVLEAYAKGFDRPFMRIELEFWNPNPQRIGEGKEYAAYFWIQETMYKMPSFTCVLDALRTGVPIEPASETSARRVQAVPASSLYSVCGNECAVRARDVLYCLPELLRLGYGDFTKQTVETKLTAVLPRLRMLSPISNLINDPGTIDVYVGRIPKVA